jgi:hypothetical protein
MKIVFKNKIEVKYSGDIFTLQQIEDGVCSLFSPHYDDAQLIHIYLFNLTLVNIRDILDEIESIICKFDYKSKDYVELKNLIQIVYGKVEESLIADGFTPKQASTISYKAYEDGHSAGYSEVVNYCIGYSGFAKDILK